MQLLKEIKIYLFHNGEKAARLDLLRVDSKLCCDVRTILRHLFPRNFTPTYATQSQETQLKDIHSAA
jgi:hypothetical protein